MTAMPFSFPIFKAFTTTGTLGPLAGGLLHTFEAGTSTPLAVYQDAALTTPHTNPVVLDSNGQATIYLGPNAYKMRLEDSTGAVQPGWPIDGIEDPLDNAKDYTDTLRADLAASSGSSMVGFIQSGASAVARTVQDKGRDSVSVKDFGAVGNGIADDTDAFAAAIAVGGSTGRAVYAPKGTYLTNIILDTVPLKLVGDGRRTTILKPFTNSPVVTIGNAAAPFQGCDIHDLGIENTTGFTSPAVLFADTTQINDHHKLERLYIANFTSGLEIKGRTIWTTLRDIEISTCSAEGIKASGTNLLINHLKMEHCSIQYCQGHGAYFNGNASPTLKTLSFDHCNFENCGLDNAYLNAAGLYLKNVEEVEITNCYLESNAETNTGNLGCGIRITGTVCASVNIHSTLSWSTQNAVYNDASLSNGVYSGNRLAGSIKDMYIATTHADSSIAIGPNYFGGGASKITIVQDVNSASHVSGFGPECLMVNSETSATPSAYNREFINYANGSPINVSNFTNGRLGQRLVLFNNGANTVTLIHAATNGIYCPGGANYAMSAGKSATLVNDGTRGWVVTCTT